MPAMIIRLVILIVAGSGNRLASKLLQTGTEPSCSITSNSGEPCAGYLESSFRIAIRWSLYDLQQFLRALADSTYLSCSLRV